MFKKVRLLFVVSFWVFAGLYSTVAQTRAELNGGTYKVTYSTGKLAEESKRAKIREFVWNSWTNRTRARITAIHYGIDGFPLVTKIFVRNSSNGAWFVEILLTQRYGLLGMRTEEIERSKYNDVDRVEVITSAD